MRRVLLLFCLVVSLPAQHGPVNLDFKEIAIDGKPPGWSWTGDPSYSVTIFEDCRTPNSRCVMFHSQSDRVPRGRGMFLQTFDASAFRGKQVRYSAWLRVEAPMVRTQLFLRVDRPSGTGFSSYSANKKTESSDWTMNQIVGKIDPDAVRITIGMMLSGMGGAAITDTEFETVKGPA
jgi:hypothetical protein